MTADLPKLWASVRLGDVCEINPRTRPALPPESLVSFVPMAAVDEVHGEIRTAESRPLAEVSKGYTPFQENDVLFAKITPCMENGKAAVARGLTNGVGFGSTEFHVLRAGPLIEPDFIYFILRSPPVRSYAASTFQGAVGQQRVPASFLEKFRIPLPPLSEQQRIVEILQEAEHIRRLRSQAEAKTAELIPAIFESLFPGGDARKTVPLASLADIVSGVAIGRKMRARATAIPYLRVANVQAGFLNLAEIKETLATDAEIRTFGLKAGDVLLIEGGDADKLGRGCLWSGEVSLCIHQNHVFRVRPDSKKLDSVFFAEFLQSPIARAYFLRCAKRTTNLASINLTQLKGLPVPVVPIERQIELRRLILAAKELPEAEENKLRELSASLLAHAFTGELTAEWRTTRRGELAEEARLRDATLAGRVITMRGTARAVFTATARAVLIRARRQEGAYSELTDPQHTLLELIETDYYDGAEVKWFTGSELAGKAGGLHRGNCHLVESDLAVLSARGLVIEVSRQMTDAATAETLYGTAYRLPQEDIPVQEGNPREPVDGERIRLRELQRLAAKLEKERML